MDRDGIAPGWNLGFGKIINMVEGGIVQVDGDGSRRYFSGVKTIAPDKVTFKGETTDGTFIKSLTETSGFNLPGYGICYHSPTTYLKYPNGVTVKYTRWSDPGTNGCFLPGTPITMAPTEIRDKDGNRIKIVYYQEEEVNQPGKGSWINYIYDTLGRTYTFNYEYFNGRNYLTSIT
jgi:hypothetical protein